METQKVLKKKRQHFFETYILKVMKQISDNSSITSNAKQQINSLLCILTKYISNKVINLIMISKKKTVSEKEIANALKIILSGELLNNSVSEGEKACSNFKNYKEDNIGKGILYKQNKAGIIFPPALIEKFLRQFGYVKVMISTTAPVYLAAVLEYITFEILDLSNNYCKDNKRARINIRDVELSIRTDVELDNLCSKLNINLLGGGVIPFIHSSLLKKNIKKTLKHSEDNKINRRFHSGTVAIRDIKKQQKFSDSLIFAKKSFEKFSRQIFNYKNHDIKKKKSKDILIVLQYFIEQYIVNVLRNANLLVIHAGRVKLLPVDIGLISFFNNKSKNPYSDSTEYSIELLSITSDTSSINS